MPGWYKVCQIGRAEQQFHLQHLLHLEFKVDVWLVHSCVQFAVSADWEAPGKWVPPIGDLSQNLLLVFKVGELFE